MCVYGRYAPDINYYIGEVRTGQRSKAFALTTTTVQLLPFTHTPEAPTAEDGPEKMFTAPQTELNHVQPRGNH